MIGVKFYERRIADELIKKCLKKNLLLFSFLSTSKAIRISPPLNIKKSEIIQGCKIILNELKKMASI